MFNVDAIAQVSFVISNQRLLVAKALQTCGTDYLSGVYKYLFITIITLLKDVFRFFLVLLYYK